jgi:hypothetical protein
VGRSGGGGLEAGHDGAEELRVAASASCILAAGARTIASSAGGRSIFAGALTATASPAGALPPRCGTGGWLW